MYNHKNTDKIPCVDKRGFSYASARRGGKGVGYGKGSGSGWEYGLGWGGGIDHAVVEGVGYGKGKGCGFGLTNGNHHALAQYYTDC